MLYLVAYLILQSGISGLKKSKRSSFALVLKLLNHFREKKPFQRIKGLKSANLWR